MMDLKGIFLFLALGFVLFSSHEAMVDFTDVLNIMDSTRNEILEMEKSYIKRVTPVEKSVIKDLTGSSVIKATTLSKTGFSLKLGGTSGGAHKSRSKTVLSVRRRPLPKPKPKPKPKLKKITGAPLNKHNHAIYQIEKGIMEAGAMRQDRRSQQTRKVNMLKREIVSASNIGELVFARQALGHLIYNNAIASKGRRSRRQASKSSPLKDIARILGEEKYQALMALDGRSTLAFAIDTTGSMRDESVAAKKIASDIIRMGRKHSVDYVLSPFNDPATSPGHGPVSYFAEDEMNKMLTALNTLKVQGGGDCPELTMEGIQRIFTVSIALASPIYVFTDAGAKDLTEDSYDHLIESADIFGTPINFFISKSGCVNKKALDDFTKIAKTTGGEILQFDKSSKLKEMSSYMNASLVGGSPLPAESNLSNRRRRRATSSANAYSILVDDTIDTLTTSVSTSSRKPKINLKNPSGVIQVSSKTDTGNGAIYVVHDPTPGIWTLSVNTGITVNSVTAKGVSLQNIDFEYHFLVEIPDRKRKTVKIASKFPVIATKANAVVITITSPAMVVSSSLRLTVTDRTLKKIQTVNLRQMGPSHLGRYSGDISCPSHEFLFILDGKVLSGRKFKRLSQGSIRPTTLLARILMARNGFTVQRGPKGTAVLIAVHNFGKSEMVRVKAIDKEGFIRKPFRHGLRVMNNRMALLSLRFVAPPSAKAGRVYKASLSIQGTVSKRKTMLMISLLVA